MIFWHLVNNSFLHDDSFLSRHQWQNFHGPEFVKMASEPGVALSVPSSIMVRMYPLRHLFFKPKYPRRWQRNGFKAHLQLFSAHKMRGKVEEVQRKVGVVLLNGQKLELSCDIKAVCKDVLDMVVAHIGLVEHHLFGLAYLRGNVCRYLVVISVCSNNDPR